MAEKTSAFKSIAALWDRTSLVMRLVIFVGIGFGIYYWVDSEYIASLTVKRNELKTAVDAGKPPENYEDSITKNMQQSTKLAAETRTVNADIAKFTESLGSSSINEVRQSIMEAFNRYGVTIVSEGRPAKAATKLDDYGNYITLNVEQAKIFPDPIASHTFVYHAYGSFGGVHKFLLDMYRDPRTFLIRDIKIMRSPTHTYTEGEGRVISAVEITFSVHIPFKGGAK